MGFILFILLIVSLWWLIDVFPFREPLSRDQEIELAIKRQKEALISRRRFSTIQKVADLDVKKKMRSKGEFKNYRTNYYELPSEIAALLKYKKHEWVVIAFVSNNESTYLWWNKGDNNVSVLPYLNPTQVLRVANIQKSEAIAIFHNHPNPDPSRYRMNIASKADIQSAKLYSSVLNSNGINLLEFICERGTPYMYYASLKLNEMPKEKFLPDIKEKNGTGIFANRALRKELIKRTPLTTLVEFY